MGINLVTIVLILKMSKCKYSLPFSFHYLRNAFNTYPEPCTVSVHGAVQQDLSFQLDKFKYVPLSTKIG